jgi:TolA-binding protein
MDDKANDSRPAADPVPDPEHGAPARSVSADRLVSRLAELRAQVDVLAPPDQERGREAIERIRQAQERIGALELMLARAREREDSLTVQTVRDRAALADREARIAELGAIAARVAASEAARREEEAAAAEAKRQLTLVRTEAEARQTEIERLRARCAELESDLSRLAGEVAAAAVARAEASRTERERDEARDRAYTERRLAAQDRQRAAEANLRATELQSQLRAAERKIVQLTNGRSGSVETETPSDIVEPPRTEAPWTTLQRVSSAAAGSSTSATETVTPAPPPSDSDPTPASDITGEPSGEADVIDLTQEDPNPADQDTEGDASESGGEPAGVGARPTKSEGFLSRMWRGRHPDRPTGL